MDKIETPRTFVENHTGYGGDKFNALEQNITARDALIRADERQKAAGWISVKERLPEDCDITLCLTHSNDHRQVVCKFYEKDFYDEVGLLRDVTHWMPLPEPPALMAEPEEA